MAKLITREGWLMSAMKGLDREFFKRSGHELPDGLRVSVGFIRGHGDKAIGQCWSPKASEAQRTEMFICPRLSTPVEVLATLLHEMIHAAVGVEEGHKDLFRKMVKEFGLAGKMTATYAEPGSECFQRIEKVVARLGEYPHAKMNPSRGPRKGKGGGGWIRLQSTEDNTYRLLISPKMVDAHGYPQDPWGNEMEPVEQGE